MSSYEYIINEPKRDCQFTAFTSAYEAGTFVHLNLAFDDIFHFQIEGESLIVSERRLKNSHLTAEEKLAAVDSIMDRLKAREQNGIIP